MRLRLAHMAYSGLLEQRYRWSLLTRITKTVISLSLHAVLGIPSNSFKLHSQPFM